MLLKKRFARQYFLVFLIFSIAIVYTYYFLSNKKSSIKPLMCSGQPCNVILIVADTLSAKHMSLYGYNRETTPFIDQFFGKEGIVFKNVSSNATWTLSSFASFFTSQYPSDVRVESFGDVLSDEYDSLPKVLRQSGVKQAAFLLKGTFLDKSIFNKFRYDEVVFAGGDKLQFLAADQWLSAWQGKSNNQTFFMLIHTLINHIPYDPAEQYRHLFGAPSVYPGPVTDSDIAGFVEKRSKDDAQLGRFRLQYDQRVRELDDVVKSFMENLPDDVKTKTVIILTSDHGEAFGEHNNLVHAGLPYEEEVHVPLVIWGPQLGHRVVDSRISLLDLTPTIFDIFGIKAPESFKGRSLIPAVKNGFTSEMPFRIEGQLTSEDGKGNAADLEWRVREEPLSSYFFKAERFGNWKLIIDNGKDSKKTPLFRLDKDPNEKRDLFNQLGNFNWRERLQVKILFDELGVTFP